MKKLTEFSKRFIVVAAMVWIAGAVYGAVIIGAQLVASIIHPDAAYMPDLASYLTYLAAPLTGGILGYMAKAAFENREKIRQHFMAPDTGAESEHSDEQD